MLITTKIKPSKEIENYAKKLAWEMSFLYVSRGINTLATLKRYYKEEGIVVVDEEEIKFMSKDGKTFFFHQSMARIRISSLLTGNKDKLLEMTGAQQGDVILDCTLGLATDAIVLSYAVGENGQIIGIESEKVPYLLVREGLRKYEPGILEIKEAMRRIKAVNDDHLSYMKNLADKSVDIVYFDPMFRHEAKAIAINRLRDLANHSALDIRTIEEAKRVARKRIVLKEQRESGEFERLGFKITGKESGSKVSYGIIDNELLHRFVVEYPSESSYVNHSSPQPTDGVFWFNNKELTEDS